MRNTLKTQRGAVSGALVLALGLLSFVVAVAAICGLSYVSAHNRGTQMEADIQATYENNKNVLTQYSQKVLEAAQVPDMARDDLLKLTREALTGRYGAEGSKAVFQAIQEQNPQVDGALYRQIQQIIEGGRTEVKTSQTRLIDQKNVYTKSLGYFWGGMWLRIAGFPKLNLDDYKVLTTDRVEEAFKAGKEAGPLQLRPAAR